MEFFLKKKDNTGSEEKKQVGKWQMTNGKKMTNTETRLDEL